MTDTALQNKETRIDKISKWLSIGANAVVIIGIILAFVQFSHMKRNEKIQNAINALNQTRSSEFLKAYTRLKTAQRGRNTQDTQTLIDDLNYVMNTYDNIALLYINDLADRCVIKGGTHTATKEVSSIFEALSYPKENRNNFDRFVALMDGHPCE